MFGLWKPDDVIILCRSRYETQTLWDGPLREIDLMCVCGGTRY